MSYNDYDQIQDCMQWLNDCGYTPENIDKVSMVEPESFNGDFIVTFTRNTGDHKQYCFNKRYRDIFAICLTFTRYINTFNLSAANAH